VSRRIFHFDAALMVADVILIDYVWNSKHIPLDEEFSYKYHQPVEYKNIFFNSITPSELFIKQYDEGTIFMVSKGF
jgi:hypothetical protein